MLSVSHARALRSVLSVAAFLTTLFSDAAAATPERIREEYARVQDTLARGPDGRPRDWAGADAARLIEAAWRLVGDRALAHVAAHPDSPASDLVTAVAELNPPGVPPDYPEFLEEYLEKNPYHLFLDATRLGDGDHVLYLLSAYYRRPLYDRRGELFVIEGTAPDAFREVHSQYDGPCARFDALPSASSRHIRVLATEQYLPMSGCDAGGHVRFLEWDGRTMRTLLHRTYNAGGGVWDVRVDGERVEVKSKGNTKVLFDCPCCDYIQATAKFRVGPKGVEDLGLEYTVPEIPLIDGFLHRALHHKDPSPFGTPKAANELHQILKVPLDPEYPDYVDMSPVMDITREGNDEIVRMNGDKPLVFRINRRDTPRVTEVRAVASPGDTSP